MVAPAFAVASSMFSKKSRIRSLGPLPKHGAMMHTVGATCGRPRANKVRPYIYDAASSMFSIKIPYPVVGPLTKTWVKG